MSWVCFCQELAKLGDDWLSYHGVVRSSYALIIHCYILEKLMLLCFIRRISLILLTPLLWLDERQWWSVCAPHFDNGVVRGYLVIDAVLFHSVITRNVVEVLTAFCVSPVVDSLARRWTNVKACWHAESSWSDVFQRLVGWRHSTHKFTFVWFHPMKIVELPWPHRVGQQHEDAEKATGRLETHACLLQTKHNVPYKSVYVCTIYSDLCRPTCTVLQVIQD